MALVGLERNPDPGPSLNGRTIFEGQAPDRINIFFDLIDWGVLIKMSISTASFNAETLLVHSRRIAQLKDYAVHVPSVLLDPKGLCDLELLLNRGYFPLQGYMGRADYETVLDSMELVDGTFWPTPVTLALDAAVAASMKPGDMLALRDQEGFMLAMLFVEDLWQPDLIREADAIFGTSDPTAQPEVERLLSRQGVWYVSGRLEGLHLPQHFDFTSLRHTPAQLHRHFGEHDWKRIIGYPSPTPLHCMHREMLVAAALEADAKILLCPMVNSMKPADVGHFSSVRSHALFVRRLPHNLAMINLTPLRDQRANLRSVLLQTIVLHNYGCSHVLIQQDALCMDNDAQKVERAWVSLEAHQASLDIVFMRVKPRVYLEELGIFVSPGDLKPEMAGVEITHSKILHLLEHGSPIPEWMSYPEVIEEIRRTMPPRSRQGLTLFLTGLSGAGKSTLAKVLYVKLLELQDRPVTLLDGDVVRCNLSSELGFNKEHRNLNVTRIGFVASEITKNRGIAICAPIAPYAQSRAAVRSLISTRGGFVEIFMATPLAVCEQRDRKGLYAKARAGVLKGVTGVDDPYEVPEHPEIAIDTSEISSVEAADRVITYLVRAGYIEERTCDS